MEIARIRLIILCLAALCLFPCGARGEDILHAPHDAAHGLSCQSCHQYSLAGETWGLSFPPGTPSAEGDFKNFICLRCHDGSADEAGEIAAPVKAMHSALSIQGRIADWSTRCTDCHDPHFQAQLNHLNASPSPFLVTGLIAGLSVDTSNPDAPTTTLAVSLTGWHQEWQNQTEWANKTGANRGLILATNGESSIRTHEITAATASSITVTGEMPATAIGENFGIIYGQLIRGEIRLQDGTTAEVQLFDPRLNASAGGFVNSDNTGLCQTCHTRTRFYTNNGGGASHYTANCRDCHNQTSGFKPTGPDHSTRIAAVAFCQGCHSGEPVSIHSRNSCSTCHEVSNNYNLVARLQTDLASLLVWNEAKQKKMLSRLPVTCADCHLGSDQGHVAAHDHATTDKPSCRQCHLANMVEEHVLRRDFSCKHCHDRAGLGLAAIAAVTNAIAAGQAGTQVFCSTCHNDAYFSATGSFVDEHHRTTAATEGDCAACHTVGRGLDAPRQMACATCHGAGKWFDPQRAGVSKHDHGPAITNVKDFRACLSCHLENGPGHDPGPSGLPPSDPAYDGTPVVRPYHAKPDSIPYMFADTTLNSEEEARQHPGLGSFNLFYGQQFQATDLHAPGTNYYNYFYTQPLRYNTFGRAALPHALAPIKTDGATHAVPSLDSTGGGGPVSGSGSLSVTITPPEAITAGAQWRLDGSAWQPSGATASNLSVSVHPLQATMISGWATPRQQSIGITDGNAAAAALAYAQCPTDTAITISRTSGSGANITWSTPSQAETFQATGWKHGEIEWQLVAGNAKGFTLISTGPSSATLKKDGPTTDGTYALTIRAKGSDCPGNQAEMALTVTVPASGAGSPDSISGTIGSRLKSDIEYSVWHQSLGAPRLFQVSPNLFGILYLEATNSYSLWMKTFRIENNGRATLLDTKMMGNCSSMPSAQKISDGVFAISYRQANDYIVYNSNVPVYIKTIAINQTTGIINTTALATYSVTATGEPKLTSLGGDVYAMNLEENVGGSGGQRNCFLKTFRINSAGTSITAIDSWQYASGITAPTSYYERREVNQPAIAQVAGNVYAFSYEAERSPTGATPWERIGKVSTITITNGVITTTPIDTLTFETEHCAWPRLRRIAGDVFLVAYDGLVSSTLTTLRISDSGEIGDQPINTLMFDSGSLDNIIPVAGDVYSVATTPLGLSNKGNAVRTFRVAADGRITPKAVAEKFFNRPTGDVHDYYTQADVIQVNGTVFAFAFGGQAIKTGGGLKTLCIYNPDTDDADHEGVCDQMDNCPAVANPDQADTDGDGIGNACDPTP